VLQKRAPPELGQDDVIICAVTSSSSRCPSHDVGLAVTSSFCDVIGGGVVAERVAINVGLIVGIAGAVSTLLVMLAALLLCRPRGSPPHGIHASGVTWRQQSRDCWSHGTHASGVEVVRDDRGVQKAKLSNGADDGLHRPSVTAQAVTTSVGLDADNSSMLHGKTW